MSPHEYLAELQQRLAKMYFTVSEGPVHAYFTKERPDIVAAAGQFDETVSRVVKQVSDRYGPLDAILDELKPKILLTCCEEERDLLAPIPVGSIFTDDPNGWVISAPTGEPVIGVHTGVMHLCYWTSSLVAALHWVDKDGVKERPVPDNERLRIASRYRNSCLSLLGDDSARAHDVHIPLNRWQHLLGAYVMQSMEMFILGHEFGHVCLGHLTETMSSAAAQGVRYYVTESERQEFDADGWSQGRMTWIKQHEEELPREEWWMLDGGILALSALRAIERVFELLPESRRASLERTSMSGFNMSLNTHPPTLERRTRLLGLLDETLGPEDPDCQDAHRKARLMDTIIATFDYLT